MTNIEQPGAVSPDVVGAAAGLPERQRARSPVRLLAILCLCVGIAVIAVHRPALGAKATNFDDGQYILENRLVQNPSWDSLGVFFGEIMKPSTVAGYYQPLAMSSLMLDWALGGRADDLRPFHRTSLLLHVFNVVLVIVLLYTLFGNPWVAAGVGLLFGIHPQTVECIPWVGERKTLLAAFFALWCFLLYVLYVHRRNWTCYGLALLAFLLALLSKPTSTPVPVLLLLMDYWPLRRFNRRAVLEKIPFFVIGGASAIVTFVSQARSAALLVLPEERSTYQIPLTLCHNIIFYLYKMVWPTHLTSHYAFPEPFNLSQPMLLAGVIGTVILIPLLVLSLRWTRAPLTGWLFFFVAIFPTMGVITFTNVIASDKYIYLPVFGLLMVLALALVKLWEAPLRRHWLGVARAGLVMLVLGLGAAETWATRAYLAYWKDTITLYRYMLTFSPRAWSLYDYLGVQLCDQGQLDEAIEQFHKALELRPNDFSVHNNLGVALANQAMALAGQQDMAGAQAKFAEAMENFAQAVRVNPKFASAYSNIGRAFQNVGQNDPAQTNFERALEIDPLCVDAHKGLAILLATQGKFADAEVHFRDAIRIHPAYVEAYIGLGRVLLAERKVPEAVGVFLEAQRIAPNDPRVRADLDRLATRLTPTSLPAPPP